MHSQGSPVPDWQRLGDAERHALARRLYAQAGYSAQHPLRITLYIPSQDGDSRHFFEAITASWYSILGAEVRLYEEEFKVLAQERNLHKLPLFYDAWIGDYPDPYTFMQIRYSGNGNNNAASENNNAAEQVTVSMASPTVAATPSTTAVTLAQVTGLYDHFAHHQPGPELEQCQLQVHARCRSDRQDTGLCHGGDRI